MNFYGSYVKRETGRYSHQRDSVGITLIYFIAFSLHVEMREDSLADTMEMNEKCIEIILFAFVWSKDGLLS